MTLLINTTRTSRAVICWMTGEAFFPGGIATHYAPRYKKALDKYHVWQ